MKPAWFEYHAPPTLHEALHILAEAGTDGRVLAGGQSLVPMLNFRIARPAVIVDINRIDELDCLDVTPNELRVGARIRHAQFLRDPRIREGWPLLAEATAQVAHMAIRNRGTVCGSICHNDPAAEQPGVLTTMQGVVEIASAKGRRELPASEFLTGLMSTALEPGEMVVAVRYPRSPAGTSTAFVEFARRLGDFAIAGAAVSLAIRGGICQTARVTIIGMGRGPFVARAAEAILQGADLAGKSAAAAIGAAAASVVDAVDPADDVHATAAYRRHLAGVMATRALETAVARSKGG